LNGGADGLKALKRETGAEEALAVVLFVVFVSFRAGIGTGFDDVIDRLLVSVSSSCAGFWGELPNVL